MLVVETEHRAPAIPGHARAAIADRRGARHVADELLGAGELAPQLPGRTFLQIGGVMVPLRSARCPRRWGTRLRRRTGPAGDAQRTRWRRCPSVLEASQLRSSELAAESARRRAAEAEAAVVELVARVGRSSRSSRRRGRSPTADRSDRRAASAGCARRAARPRRAGAASGARAGAARAEPRRRARAPGAPRRASADLERELTRMRRAVDEAQHLVAAAKAASAGAETAPGRPSSPRPAPAPPRPAPSRAAVSRRDRRACSPAAARARLSAARADALPGEAAPARPAPTWPERRWPCSSASSRIARRGARRVSGCYASARTTRSTGYAASSSGSARCGSGAGSPSASESTSACASAGAAASRAGSGRAAQRGAGSPARADAADAREAPARAIPRPIRPSGPADLRPSADLAEPARAAKPWLGRRSGRSRRGTRPAAGRLLLALLPAQRAADPQPVAYDLVLGDLACARVTVGSADIHVERRRRTAARRRRSTSGSSGISPASPGCWSPAGCGAGSRVPPGRDRVARIRGDRARLAALEKLIDAPLTLGELDAAGVRLDPVLALTRRRADDRAGLDRGRALHDRPPGGAGAARPAPTCTSATASRRWPPRAAPRAGGDRDRVPRATSCSACSPASRARDSRSRASSARWRSCASGSIAHRAADPLAGDRSVVRVDAYARKRAPSSPDPETLEPVTPPAPISTSTPSTRCSTGRARSTRSSSGPRRSVSPPSALTDHGVMNGAVELFTAAPQARDQADPRVRGVRRRRPRAARAGPARPLSPDAAGGDPDRLPQPRQAVLGRASSRATSAASRRSTWRRSPPMPRA